ncbi:MAG: PaREP1 family protein [Thermoproteota archaeon]|jgi:hypothetical protein|nr:PaREP1 family protein [Thermoproteota archaeon]
MEELIKKLEERGIDAIDVLLDALSKVDPSESAKERINLVEKLMKECNDYLNQGDPVQASEKAYKIAEEIVKALAEKFKTPEYEEFLKEGRWYIYLLSRASKTLALKLGDWVIDEWNSAYDLHVWGFHERKLTIDYVKIGIKKLKRCLKKRIRLFFEFLYLN